MKKCETLLAKAVSEKKVNTINLAYLKDRIATFEGRQQCYEIKFELDENEKLNLQAFDDLTKVNQRRKAIRLSTFERQTKTIRAQAKNENQSPPLDFEKR